MNATPSDALTFLGPRTAGSSSRNPSAGRGESDEVAYALERQGIDMDKLAAQLQKEAPNRSSSHGMR